MIRKFKAVASLTILSLGTSCGQLLAAEKAVLQSRVAATEQVGFDVYLPIQHRDRLESDLRAMHDPGSATYRKWLTPAQFDARYAATPAQVAAIRTELAALSLETSVLAAHRIHVTGSASAVEQALGTVLKHGVYTNGQATVAAAEPIKTPSVLLKANAFVTGLSGTIRMRAHGHAVTLPQNRYSPTGGYWFDDLKQAYSFPSFQVYDGSGVTIGILGAGDFRQSDMDLYFGHEKIASPSFTTINVDGGAPFNVNGSAETHLDLQQSGGMAPNAKVLLYNIPNLADSYIIDGLSKIVTDNTVDVVSMSFGGPEVFYTAADNGGTDFTFLLAEEDDLMAQGNAQGITFIASSGDEGALAAFPPACFAYYPNCGSFLPSVNFPASSPHVTGVGGTNLVTTHSGIKGDLNSQYVLEEAYADPLSADIFYGTSATGGFWGSGGGNSILFAKPSYQNYVKTGNSRVRTVPDVSLHMGGCPVGVIGACNPNDSYDLAVIGGRLIGLIGTSASAPDFAGLTALTIQRFGTRLGNENYYIYTLAGVQFSGTPLGVYNTGIPGYNGLYYTSRNGYNRVLGNGTINGINFLLAPSMDVAGTPQTPSNP